jgi:signal transduction histidine kinase
MRLGVSGKIFLAYAALVATFVASSIFTLLYLDRARELVVGGQLFFELQGYADAAWRKLEANVDASRDVRTARWRLPLDLAEANKQLAAAIDRVDHVAPELPLASPLLPTVRECRGRLEALQTALDEEVQALLPDFLAGDPAKADLFRSGLAKLTFKLQQLRRDTGTESRATATELSRAEVRARSYALTLGGVGLAVAIGVALFLVFTLRPLKLLRERARAVAGGDYASRVGVRSPDEIGDLSREFDAMAVALEEREHRLIRSERLATVGHMAAHVTHEIRNPLASIGLYAELLADELPADNAEARKLVASIANEIDRLSEITDTYLRFVRLPRPRREPEDLVAVVRDAVEFARRELAQAAIELHVALPDGALEASVDENQIRQALLNLIRNAREAMPQGGRLAVTLERIGDDARLRISDTGAGISADDVGKIFDPFFSTKDKGTGLGLALVQQIVSDHGGRIEVETGERAGTTFAVTLPLIAAPTDAHAPVRAASVGEPSPALARRRLG